MSNISKGETKKSVKTSRGLLFDIVITLIVIGVLVTGLYFSVRSVDDKRISIEYMVVFDKVKNEIAAKIKVDADIFTEDRENAGRISEALSERAEFYTIDRTESAVNGYIKNVSDEYRTIKVTIKAEADFINNSYYIGNTRIKAGEELMLGSADFYGSAVISAVSVDTR